VSDDRSPLTSYYAVVDEGTLWRKNRGVSKDEVKDGLNKTIMLIDVQRPPIHWMEPRDITMTELTALFEREGAYAAPHDDKVNVIWGWKR